MSSIFEMFYALMKEKNILLSKAWGQARQHFGNEWEQQISRNLEVVFGATPNEYWEEAIDGYVAFCMDSIKAQHYFEKHDEYPAKSYDDCVLACYKNPEYMKKRYLPGQFISHYIWPHHYNMLRHYQDCVIPGLQGVRRFYEVGVGCGMYSLTTLSRVKSCSGFGVDISDYSLSFTKEVVDSFGFADRYAIYNHDIFNGPPAGHADYIICQEVLEHIENPAKFIIALREMVAPGGHGYITAAINAAHTDHIYLYRSPKEVRAQIENAGWVVELEHVQQALPYKPEHLRPTVAAFFCSRGITS